MSVAGGRDDLGYWCRCLGTLGSTSGPRSLVKLPTFNLTVVFGAAGTVIAGTVVVIEAVEVTLTA